MSKLALRTIASGSIETGKIPFSLHCTSREGDLVLFCNKGLEISPEDMKTLGRRDRVFYVYENEADDYYDYVADHLDSIVQNENMRIDDKSDILYSLGKRVAKLLFENPRSGKVVKQSRKFVNSYLELILKTPKVSERLFRLSSTDTYLLSHSVNVCTFCLLIGEKVLGRNRSTLRSLGIGGLLHDIGKALVPKEILNKPGRLTEEEFDKVKEHAAFGYGLGKEHGLNEQVLSSIRSHHERMDGSGYPDGLQGDEITPFARITAVADIYDAITTKRVYCGERQHTNALKEMANERHLLDPESFSALLEIVLHDEKLARKFVS